VNITKKPLKAMNVLMLCKGFEKQQIPGYPQVSEICRAVSHCSKGA